MHHTQWLYFKETGEQQWHQGYRAAKEDFSDESPYGLYYQDVLQVYFKETENAPAVLLYDFGLEKGESVSAMDNVLWMVDTVYSMQIEGLPRRCQEMVSDNGETDVWIEGLGSSKTGFFPSVFFEDTFTELLCVQTDVFWHRGYMYHNTKYNACHIEETTDCEFHTDQQFAVSVFPNPAKETITLRATGCNLQKVEILDVNGRVLHAATVNGTETFDYNVSQMPSGIYLARVKTSCGVLTEKFSVK